MSKNASRVLLNSLKRDLVDMGRIKLALGECHGREENLEVRLLRTSTSLLQV